MDSLSLFAIIVSSIIGLGFFYYAKRISSLWFLISGICLMVYPYFVDSAIALVLIGIVLTAAPFLLENYI